jgi:ribosome maturation factor RimP
MLMNDPEDPVFQDLDHFFQAQGCTLVDLGLRTNKGTTSVHVVLHSPQGLGIDDLSKVHRLLVPRLEELLKTDELALELGSPGLERVLKYKRELGLYQGKKAKLYLQGASDWEEGVLAGFENETLTFQTPSGSRPVTVGQIQKAKLHDL